MNARKDSWRDQYEATDFGRRYGWWLCVDGKRVAELDYVAWDTESQFWHIYQVLPLHPNFDEVGYDPEQWCTERVSLQSRYAPAYFAQGILMATRPNQTVALRSVCLPEDVFREVIQITLF